MFYTLLSLSLEACQSLYILHTVHTSYCTIVCNLGNKMMCNLNLIGSYHFVGPLHVLVHLLGPSGLVVALGAGLVRLAVVAIL